MKCHKLFLILFFVVCAVSPQLVTGDEIDSLNVLLSETHDAIKKIEVYTILSKKYQQIDLAKAADKASAALQLSESTGNDYYLGEVYGLLGDIAVMQDSLEQARYYYEISMEVLKKQDDKYSLAGVAMVLGNIAFVQDKLPEALKYYHDAVDYATQSNHEKILDDLYLNIGSINHRIKNTSQAQEYFTKALESFIKNNDSLNIANAYSNLGLTYLDLKDYDLGEDYFNKALTIYLSLNAYSKSAKNYMYMASAKNRKLQYDNAIGFLLLSLDYLDKKDDTYAGPRQIILAEVNIALGLNYLALKDFHHARQYLRVGYKLGLTNGQVRLISEASEGLALMWEGLSQLDSVVYYQKIFKSFSDSLINEENIKRLAYQDAQFKYEQLLTTEKLKRQTEADIQKRNRLLYMVIIIALVMLLLVLVLFLQLSRSKIKRGRLEQASLMNELELRNKELTTHVLYQVKNNEFILSLAKKLKIALSIIKPENRSKVNEVIQEIEMDANRETWKEFELRFQNVHTSFYQKLSKKYPDLTSNELRICAFLKLNMSTKDIAAITYQTTNSITVARWRLRQKFGLEKDENLVSYLSQY